MRALLLLAGALAAWVLPNGAVEAGGAAYKLLKLDGQFVKWGVPQFGTPAVITYAYADGPIADPNARNCKSMDRLDAVALRSGLGLPDITAAVEASFRLWEQAGGVIFEKAADVASADIVIGAQAVPRGRAYTNVREGDDEPRTVLSEKTSERGLGAEEPATANGSDIEKAPVRSISRSAICINPEQSWKIGYDGNLDVYDLGFTFAHEVGHAIGLDHPSRKGEVMYFKYSEEFSGLQPGDISGIVRLYGPAAPSN